MKRNLSDPQHPIWNLCRTIVVGGLAAFVMWLNASNFDHTEHKAILQMFIAYIGIDFGLKKLQGKDTQVDELQRQRDELDAVRRKLAVEVSEARGVDLADLADSTTLRDVNELLEQSR